MKDLFQDFLDRKKTANWANKRILVAVSGGVDSMVLLHLLHRSGCEVAVAHCNYQLRDQAADLDELLVKDYAELNKLPFHLQHFPTKAILDSEGGNLQDTARRLRFEWFKTLLQTEGYDLVAMAHHAQDSVETMLYNLFSGTGIAGLHGILPQQGKVIRPLLPYFKVDLIQFAEQEGIKWREDHTNRQSAYTRNKIRNILLPQIQAIFPEALQQLTNNIPRFQEAESLYQQSIERYRLKLLEQRKSGIYIAVKKIRHCQPLATITWELLRPFGFRHTQLPDLLHLLDAESGKYVCSATHRILRNRDHLIVSTLLPQEKDILLLEVANGLVQTAHFQLHSKEITWSDTQDIPQMPPTEAMIAAQDLKFPLLLRPWKAGDYFYPLGLNKKKKVARFLIDIKMPLHEKEQVWVVESDRKIVWVVGHRIDHRFRIEKNTQIAVSLKWIERGDIKKDL